MTTAGHTQRPMSLEVRLAAGMQLFVAAAACLYWGAWYGGGRALIATQDSELYIGFLNACVFADLWLHVHPSTGLLAVLLLGGCAAFRACHPGPAVALKEWPSPRVIPTSSAPGPATPATR